MVVWSSDAGQFMVDCKVVVVGACNTGQFLVGYTKVVVCASNANANPACANIVMQVYPNIPVHHGVLSY